MKHSILIIIIILIAQMGVAQSIEGIVFDKETGEKLPFANVILFEDSVQIGGMTTSMEGEYFFHIAPGTYDVEAVYVGYLLGKINEVVVTEGTTKADIEMEIDEKGVNLSDIEISNLNIKLIRKDETLPRIKQGVIKGKVFDEKTKEELPFADVILLQNGNQVVVTMSDFSGRYMFYGLKPGKYDVEVVYVGYPNSKITGILVEDNTIPLDISMQEGEGKHFLDIQVIEVNIPFFRWEKAATTGATWKAHEIKRFPGF